MNIIDFHVHHYLGRESIHRPKPVGPLMRLARQAGIVRVNLLGNLFRYGIRPSESQNRAINSVTIAQVKKYPDFLTGFCYLNPELSRKFLENEIVRCIRDGGLRGIKLEIDVNCRDRRLDVIMEKAEEYGVPVVQHSWYKSTGKDSCESDPSDVAYLASRHPDVPVVMPHLAGVGIRGVLDVRPYPNVHIDTSGGQPVADIVEYAVGKLGPERIIYGSDVVVRDFSCQIAKVAGAAISDNAKEYILFKNAMRLLKLESVN
jgi:uncharacterized protein